MPRGMVEDPFAGSYYFLEESPESAAAVPAEPVNAEVAPRPATILSAIRGLIRMRFGASFLRLRSASMAGR